MICGVIGNLADLGAVLLRLDDVPLRKQAPYGHRQLPILPDIAPHCGLLCCRHGSRGFEGDLLAGEGIVSWSTFGYDVRYALRMLRQSPVFTAVTVTSLALGIGANTAIFTLADAILLRSLPVQNPQELVVLASNPSEPSTASSYPDYLYLRDHSRSYTGLIALWGGGVTRFSLPNANSAPQLTALALVSGNYFEVLGVPPALGRVFNPSDNERPGARPYVILSHAFWKRSFGGDKGIVGRDIMLNGV